MRTRLLMMLNNVDQKRWLRDGVVIAQEKKVRLDHRTSHSVCCEASALHYVSDRR